MAEVRRCFGRGAHYFAHKRPFYLLETVRKQAKTVSRASALPAGLLWDGDLIYGLYGAETPAEGAATRVGYTRLEAPTAADEVPVLQNLAEEYLSPRKSQAHTIGRYLSCCDGCVRIWRTFRGSPGGQMASIRAYSTNGVRSEPLYRTKTGYYDILEVSSTATQAQIKTAYYKQSFAFHPDRNAGSDEATVRFSEISEAYTVLGNIMLRKKYDRGLLSLADLTATSRPSKKDSSSAGKQQSRRSVTSSASGEGVFDFDNFIKSYYSEQVQRDKDAKARREERKKREEEEIQEKRMDRLSDVAVVVMLVMAIGLVVSVRGAR